VTTTADALLKQFYLEMRKAYRTDTDEGILDLLDQWMTKLREHLEQNK
jgi:hypothetical protein